MKKIDFTGSEWKTQLYEYTVDLVRSMDKFRGVSEYDLEDIIQYIYLYILNYSIRKIDSLGSVSCNRNMGNWSARIRGFVDVYDVSNLYCKDICCSGYSYIDDSTLVNKDVIRSLENRVRYKNEKDIIVWKSTSTKGRLLREITEDFGVSTDMVRIRIERELRRLKGVASRMYDYGEWGEMRE